MQIFDPPPPAPRRRPRLRIPLRIPWRPPAFSRRPLTWIIAAEGVVCLAFLGAAWHLLANSLPTADPVAGPLPAAPPAQPTMGVPNVSALLPSPGTAASARARPGLGENGAFLGGLLGGLNQDEASFERAEWAGLQALSAAIRAYIERVIVPAVEKAAHSTSGRSP